MKEEQEELEPIEVIECQECGKILTEEEIEIMKKRGFVSDFLCPECLSEYNQQEEE